VRAPLAFGSARVDVFHPQGFEVHHNRIAKNATVRDLGKDRRATRPRD
jgi:hypothetical protein